MPETPTSIKIETDPGPRLRPDRTHYVFIAAGMFVVGSLFLFYLSSPGRKAPRVPTLREEAEGHLTWEASGAKSSWLFHFAKKFRAAGDFADEVRMLDEIAKSATATKEADDRAKWLVRVAEEYVRLHRVEDAKIALKDAGPAAREAKYPWDQACRLAELSVALLHVGERDAGERALREAEAVEPKLQQAITRLPAKALISVAWFEYGNVAQAEWHSTETIRYAENYFNIDEQADASCDAAAIFYKAGRSDIGRKLFDIGYAAALSIGNDFNRASTLDGFLIALEPYQDQLPLKQVEQEALRAAEKISDNPGKRSWLLKIIPQRLTPAGQAASRNGRQLGSSGTVGEVALSRIAS